MQVNINDLGKCFLCLSQFNCLHTFWNISLD